MKNRFYEKKLEDYLGEILIPVESIENIESGVRKTRMRKCFPGYIFIELQLNNKTWDLITKTSKVIGFVGDSKNPPPLNKKEISSIQMMIKNEKTPRKKMFYVIGDHIRINNGPFMNFNGIIEEINFEKEKMKVMVSIFGRLTPVELDFSHVEKII